MSGELVRRSRSVGGLRDYRGCGVGRKVKSLPNLRVEEVKGKVVVKEGKKVSQRPRILRKTWDRVKGIVRSPGGRKGSGGGGSDVSVSSTPVEEDEKERIARNYKLLQRRLSQEFRDGVGKGDEVVGKKVEGVGGGKGLLSSREVKELAWLDKQLEKIEGEKRRLEEELKRQVEREVRVRKMKEAIRCSGGGERGFNIRTESGVRVRVEGITCEYARKVYLWEEKRGINASMSALGYFDPKYLDDEEDGEEKDVSVEVKEKEVEEEVVGPLDLINERLKGDGQGSSVLDERVKNAYEGLATCFAIGEACGGGGAGGVERDGRISSTASSCCCSGEYDYEHTDSFATKNNSGASNTDSEVFEKRCTVRRGSDCGSCSERGSPGLSALSSEDEGGGGEGVGEDKERRDSEGKGVGGGSKAVCVKQIVLEEECGGGSNVFVQTKRCLFSPVEVEGGEGGGAGVKVVGVVHKEREYKAQPKTQLNRVFGGGGVPVWCSPIGARRAFNLKHEYAGDSKLPRIQRKLPPRTNVHLPRKYTIGGGYVPESIRFGRGCLVTRSSSFNGDKGGGERGCGGIGDGFGERGIGSGGFGVSKSKSTGSIKRSIRGFLGIGGRGRDEDCGSVCDGSVGGGERGKSGFVRRIGSWIRGVGGKEGGGGSGSGGGVVG